MTWLPETAPGTTAFERVLGLCPALRDDLTAYTDLFQTLRPIDPALLERCRAHISATFGATTGAPASDSASSDVERACLVFAEKFVLDPHGISDADAAAVTAHLSAPAMVAFVEALAIFDGFTRFQVILGIKPNSSIIESYAVR
jgi:alkylhydroperoxidase family enzyme